MGSKAYGGLAYATHTHEGHNNRGAPEEAVANEANTEPNPALALSLPEVDGGPECTHKAGHNVGSECPVVENLAGGIYKRPQPWALALIFVACTIAAAITATVVAIAT